MISSVRKREQFLNSECKQPSMLDIPIACVYNNIVNKTYTFEGAKIVFRDWQSLDKDQNIALAKVLNVMEYAYANGSVGDINTLTNVLCENIIPKVRDASQMQYHIKRKLANVKTKISTKINKKIEDMYDALHAAMPQTPTSAPAANNTAAPQQQAATEAAIKSIDRILETADNVLRYDRIISNHNKLCKRFNIDRFIQESVFTSSSVGDWVLEFCKLVDTYNIPTKAKYTICLENSLYALNKNSVPYNKKDIITNVTNYFLAFNNEDWKIFDIIIKTIRSTTFYDDADIEGLDYVIKRKYKPEQDKLAKDQDYDSFFDSDRKLNVALLGNVTESKSSSINALNIIHETSVKNRAKEIFEKFKSIPNVTTSALTSMIRALFSQDDRNIIEEYPNVLQYIFGIFVVSSATAINPILGAVSLGTTLFINMHMQRKETERFISIYKKQKERAEKRLKTLKSQESKERCEAYIKQLEKDISKLESYQDDLLSEKEKEERDAEKYKSDLGDDVDFGDWNFEEAYNIASTLLCSCSILEAVAKKDTKKTIKKVEKNITDMSCDDLDIVKEFSKANPYLIDPKELRFIYNEYYDELKHTKGISKYVKMDCLKENIRDLDAYEENYMEINESNILSEMYNTALVYDAINEYFDRKSSVVMEMDFSNNIQLLIDRMKKSAIELSDKEKIMSRTLDSSLERLKNSMENALTQENREAVIRGTIIPPASKIIKLAITSTLTWMISPVLTVIYLLGTFAVSANIQAKERQIILDELDVELTMCDKYIRMAEDRNEMEKLRKLLTIKKRLEAQRSRLKYKMDIEWRTQANPSSDKKDNDYDNY